jgi:hypothetical protein
MTFRGSTSASLRTHFAISTNTAKSAQAASALPPPRPNSTRYRIPPRSTGGPSPGPPRGLRR